MEEIRYRVTSGKVTGEVKMTETRSGRVLYESCKLTKDEASQPPMAWHWHRSKKAEWTIEELIDQYKTEDMKNVIREAYKQYMDDRK